LLRARATLAGIAVLGILAAGCGTPQRGSDVRTRETIRVLAYNIHHGEGMDGRLDLERIAKLISDVNPDLVAIQEVDRGVERTGGVDQAAVLAELTGLNALFGEFMEYQGGHYGMALLSRWPIVESRNHLLPEGPEPRTALTARVRSPATGREIVFVGIHFYRTAAERWSQASRVLEIFAAEEAPVILAGDFNSQPDSEVIRGLAEVWTIPGKGADRMTFPSYAPEREIDFIMYRPAERFEVIRQEVLEEPVASDHRPVLIELAVF
jgi:endonuclease/exonuclease/phosphatase family metal-dependent hydrolase